MTIDAGDLRAKLQLAAPNLWDELGALATKWLSPATKWLDGVKGHGGYPKTFNDPIWGVIELMPWETVILDTPLMQRLRGVRQLGMAHLVYPSAGHDRLEHSRGVVEAAERMVRSLERNAENRRRFGADKDDAVPAPSALDRVAIRLAGLLHDVGHGPFSHATEAVLYARRQDDFDAIEVVLRSEFEGVTSIAAGEMIAVLLVMSDAMRAVFNHERFAAGVPPADLPPAIAARILGSRSCLTAGYLSGVISGPIDADKLDYMARDCHHAGLPLGLDLERLISKLEVVVVRPDNAPNQELRKRAETAPHHKFYEIGISQAGLGAYEQMIIARVILYDRLYYHHKVRAAEAMVRRLVEVAEEEKGSPFELGELFAEQGDDTMVAIVAGELKSVSTPSGGARSGVLGRAILDRDAYFRSFAFGARYIAGLEGLPEQERNDTKMLAWRRVLKVLDSPSEVRSLEKAIFDRATTLAAEVPELARLGVGLLPEHVVLDLPKNKVVARGGDILTRTDGDRIASPNLFFDPERWSQAYEHQKQVGFVFTPAARVPLVALAARAVFVEAFGIVMAEAADRAAKTVGKVKPAWIAAATAKGLVSAEAAEWLNTDKPKMLRFHQDELDLPDAWRTEDPGLAARLAGELNDALEGGLPASAFTSTVAAIRELASFVEMAETTGMFVNIPDLTESQLQGHLRKHLTSRGHTPTEGSEIGGGETDLILPGKLIVENKVRKGSTADPFAAGAHYDWQARRYAIAVCMRVSAVLVAYAPADEASILPQSARIHAERQATPGEARCQIRVVVPWGHKTPHDAKAPKAGGTA